MKKNIIIDSLAVKEIDQFSEDVQVKILALLEVLERDGFIKEPYGKRIDHDLFEIRVKHQGQFRALYAYIHKEEILILSAFQKKTQKTPVKEIKKAHKRLTLYKK